MSETENSMLVKCPECGTHYKIPKKKVGTNPRKMRCAKCKNPFTVARRDSLPPEGLVKYQYEEFVRESPSHPSEFGFLTEVPEKGEKESSKPAAPTRAAIPPPPGDDDVTVPIDVDEKPSSKQEAPPRPTAQSNINESAEKLFVRSTQTHFDEEDTTWIRQEPMVLDEFSMDQQSATGRLVGKIVVAVLTIIVLFFGFVAYRNGFNLSLGDITNQVAFAFSDKTYEDIPVELQDLEITVDERRTVVAADGRKIGIVRGTIRNKTQVGRSRVVLKGKLIGADGKVLREVAAPCGTQLEDVVIKNTPKGSMSKHYTKDDIPVNCKLVGESIESFQLIFDSVQKDVESASTVEVKPLSARYSS